MPGLWCPLVINLLGGGGFHVVLGEGVWQLTGTCGAQRRAEISPGMSMSVF